MNTHTRKNPFYYAVLTATALIAFAANSVLCRLALGQGLIDAAGFSVLRLLSGTLMLLLILKVNPNKRRRHATPKGSLSASLMLFVYAVAFSYAYISLDTGTGALILFGAVQMTIIVLSILSGNRLKVGEVVGVLLAFGGFVYLILPSVTTPSILGFLLMSIAGIAWGIYTLKGRGSENPLGDTAYNFFRSVPLVLVLAIITLKDMRLSTEGALLAVISGGIASGMGYSIWYMALRGLSATIAAVVQLLVPVIAALGGVIFMSEAISIDLIVSGVLILGGIGIVVLGRSSR
ncbi:DMT family transporter [Alkalimarinus coralli]|uniref:DMT family transporter n=1 Tax=Alkalimarinus coralli TaxID=2935863 RepID=UPI00202B63BC|nr:DMT family transporter [Alkalimarinus coralli]